MMYFVNESSDAHVVGDLQFYKTKADMLSYIEPWYEDVPHLVFDVEGNCYKIEAVDRLTTRMKPIETTVNLNSVIDCLKYVASGHSTDWMPEKLSFEK